MSTARLLSRVSFPDITALEMKLLLVDRVQSGNDVQQLRGCYLLLALTVKEADSLSSFMTATASKKRRACLGKTVWTDNTAVSPS